MKTNSKSLGLVAVLALAIVPMFQNCGSNVGFTKNDQGANSLSSTTPTSPNPTPTPTPPPVICDPFSDGSSCQQGQGLKGSIYYLNSDESAKYGDTVVDLIANGHKLNAQVLFSFLDVPTRDWSSGFPAGNGALLKNDDGDDLIEWFAFDLAGVLRVDNTTAGDYQFALMSDDGSILDIDMKNVIDADGQHSTSWTCAKNKISLNAGDLHAIRVRYFQGPRYQIALRLLWRPWSNSTKSCDSNGGFTPVPSSVLWQPTGL